MTLFTADCLRLHAGLSEWPGETANALSSVARVLEAGPDRDPRELAGLYYRIGMHQVAAAKYPAAIANLNMAILIDTQLLVEGRELGLEAGARHLLAAASLEYGDIAAADRHLFSPACIVERNSPEWTVLWARVLLARGDALLAAEELERLISRTGEDFPTLSGRMASLTFAAALRSSGRITEARTRLETTLGWWQEARPEAAEDAPGLGLTLLELGRCERQCGAYDQADTHFCRARDVFSSRLGARHPHVALVLYERALLAESLGRFETARHLALSATGIQRACLPARHPDHLASQALSARMFAAAEPVNFALLA